MSLDEYRDYMDRIMSPISDFLEPRGFKKWEYTFNKWTKDGLCHVFDLQMGIKSLEGEFTANLGVFVPEVYRSMMEQELPEIVRIGECMINARFSQFTDEDDKWWDITPYPGEVVPELIDLLQTCGLPFFIKFPDRQSIVDGLIAFDEQYGVAMRPELDIALILENMGKHEDAEKLFIRYYQKTGNNKRHTEYLEKLAARHNWVIT